MAVDHDEAGHLERCACCGAPLSQLWIGVCAGFEIGIGCVHCSDADYACESNDRWSTSGTVVTLGDAAISRASS